MANTNSSHSLVKGSRLLQPTAASRIRANKIREQKIQSSIDALKEAAGDINARSRVKVLNNHSRMASKSKSPDVVFGERLGIRGLRRSEVVDEIARNTMKGKLSTLRATNRILSPQTPAQQPQNQDQCHELNHSFNPVDPNQSLVSSRPQH